MPRAGSNRGMEPVLSDAHTFSDKPTVSLLGLLARGRFFGIAALISVCIFWQSPYLLTLVLLSLSCMVLIGKRNSQDLITFLTCGALGAIAEVLVVNFGAWSYSVPQFLGIPYWLPLVWGISALFIRNISTKIEHLLQ